MAVAQREGSGGGALLIRYGQFLFRTRNFVFPAVLIGLLIVLPPRPFAGSPPLDRWIDALGLALVIASQGLRAAVIGLAYIKRGGVNKRIHADALVTQGLFAHCRNPLYLGNLIMVAGYCTIHGSPWVYLLAGGFFLLSYGAIVAAEERFLHAKFGPDYEAYCRRVGRWRIELRGLPATFAGMTFNWRRVVLKDYSTTMTWMLTVLALFAYQAIAERGFEDARPTLLYIGLGALLVVVAGLGVRLLKKTRLLTEQRAPH